MAKKRSAVDITIRITIVVIFFFANELLGLIYPIRFMDRWFKKGDPSPGIKSCYAGQRVLSGAIEMYNMDHEEMLDEKDLNISSDDLVDLLAKGKYLKSNSKPYKECEYSLYARKDGVIAYCKYHGAIEHGYDPLAPGPDPKYQKELDNKKMREMLDKVMPYVIYSGLLVTAIVF